MYLNLLIKGPVLTFKKACNGTESFEIENWNKSDYFSSLPVLSIR